MIRSLVYSIPLCLALLAPITARAELSSSQGPLKVTQMAVGLEAPWSIGFLPQGGVLVTERDGALLHFDRTGKRQQVRGVPRVAANGQGGLFDVLIPRDFAQSRDVFLSYAIPQGRGAGTAVARATLSRDASRLRDVEVIFEMTRGSSGGRHFGGRLTEGPDGFLYLSTGDRADRPSAQDLSNHNGAILRITRTGAAPSGNPFVGQTGAQPHIFSYGHRNPQGMAFDRRGQLWVNEHGARGGDEVNKIAAGANYGWPVIAYGRHYSGAKIGEGTAKAGLEQPAHYWDPSIAPSGMMIYRGDMFPEWRGDLFIGSLKFDYIARLDGTPLREVEQLKSRQTGRVRDIREAPDGSIWFLSVGDGAMYRISR